MIEKYLIQEQLWEKQKEKQKSHNKEENSLLSSEKDDIPEAEREFQKPIPSNLKRVLGAAEPQSTDTNNHTGLNIELSNPINSEPPLVLTFEHSEENNNTNSEPLPLPRYNSVSDTNSDKEKNRKISQPCKYKEDTSQ